MKKAVVVFLLFLVFFLTWYGERRKFIPIGNGYVTVWKQFNDVSYVIWGKYYGLTSPSKNYIKTSNSNNLSLYISDKLPKTIIYRSDEPSIISSSVKGISFINYETDSEKFHSILYKPNAKKAKDLKVGTYALDILIKENYIINYTGKKY
ncbi:MAG: hypothetical protein ACK41Z_08745 [Sediminibacterium sp.]